jgi:hypothetical protein
MTVYVAGISGQTGEAAVSATDEREIIRLTACRPSSRLRGGVASVPFVRGKENTANPGAEGMLYAVTDLGRTAYLIAPRLKTQPGSAMIVKKAGLAIVTTARLVLNETRPDGQHGK